MKDITTKIGSGATPTGGESAYLPSREKYALVRSQNVYDHWMSYSNLAFISDEQAEELGNVALQSGDLLLNITGDGVTFGRACIVSDEILPARVNQHVAIVRPKPGVCISSYLLFYLTHPTIKEYIESFNSGGSRRAIAKGHIESFIVPVPSIAEQHAIGSVLGALNQKIELNHRTSQTLEAMVRAIFKSWFVDFDPVRDGHPLFPRSFDSSAIGLVPHAWEVCFLPKIIEVNPPRKIARRTIAPYLDMGNMPTNSARALGWSDREFGSGVKFVNGDVLVSRITPCLENGKTAFVDFLGESQVGWGSTEYIVLRSRPPLPLEYAYFLARSDRFRSHAITSMTGSTGRQRVPSSCFDALQVAIPPERVAAEFGRLSSGTMEAMKQRDEESRTLTALRDTLLPKLLSGEIRVKQAEELVEEVV